MEQDNRVVVLIDMDCFYCQVEEKLDPELKGKPIAVVQYNPWKGGGIIAVSYEARAMGVTRSMRGDEAKEKCPDIQLPSVPCQRGKADISKYRDAGKEVARVLQKFTPLLERASIDEAYLDITAAVKDRLKTLNVDSITSELMPNTFALGYNSIEEFISDVQSYDNDSIEFDYDHAKKLIVGAVVVSEIRAAVYKETGYRCSAGIAHNKILAKLVCGMNKPNKQTVLPKHSVNILYNTLSVKKVKHLGGKFGDTVCEVLRISKMGELQKFTEKELQTRFDEKNGTWLYNIARGVDTEPVQARFNPKSIGCCKQLRGKSALTDLESLRRWLKDLGDEIEDRLEKDAVENNRMPKQMVVSFSTQGPDGRDVSSSRSYNFVADDELNGDLFSGKALELVLESAEGVKPVDGESNRRLKAPIKFLGISVGKFEENSESKKTKKILDYFSASALNANRTKENTEKVAKESAIQINKKNEGKEYIMQKFLQGTGKSQVQMNLDTKTIAKDAIIENTAESLPAEGGIKTNDKTNTEQRSVLETALDKQESFFARFLDSKTNNNVNGEKTHSTTPICNVVNCGDDSNDSEYSGSTINNEINKSMALFEEDPQDVERVSHMRDLLNTSLLKRRSPSVSPEVLLQDAVNRKINDNSNLTEDNELPNNNESKRSSPENVETFQCPECGKTLHLDNFDTHADYHFALKIREKERKLARDEKKAKPQSIAINKEVMKKEGQRGETAAKLKNKVVEQKNETIASISNFFEKVNVSIPTEVCPECRKRVPLDKFTEHSDFHEAQKLSRELNKKSVAEPPSYFTGNSVKRKKKSISPLKKPKLPCNSRSIDSFFR